MYKGSFVSIDKNLKCFEIELCTVSYLVPSITSMYMYFMLGNDKYNAQCDTKSIIN